MEDRQAGILRKLRIGGRPFAKIESGTAGRLDPLYMTAIGTETDAVPLPVCIFAHHSASDIFAARRSLKF
jgi:hypothetical protein